MSDIHITPAGMVSRRDAGRVLERTPKTMAHWKMKGWGPKPITVGGRDYYDYAECLAMARGEKPIAHNRRKTRKRTDAKTIFIGFRAGADLDGQLDKLASRFGVKKSALIRQMLNQGVNRITQLGTPTPPEGS